MKKVAEIWRGTQRISPPYEFYLDYNPDGTVMPRNCELLQTAGATFYKIKLSSSRLNFASCTSAVNTFCHASSLDNAMRVELPCASSVWCVLGYSLFAVADIYAPLALVAHYACCDCTVLEQLTATMPIIIGASYFITGSKVTRLAFDFPLLTLADGFCENNKSLESVSLTTAKITNADDFAKNCPSLIEVPIEFLALSSGKNAFFNCKLSKETINAILESLPTYTTGTHIITFTGCPGAATCSHEIATSKGWIVEL